MACFPMPTNPPHLHRYATLRRMAFCGPWGRCSSCTPSSSLVSRSGDILCNETPNGAKMPRDSSFRPKPFFSTAWGQAVLITERTFYHVLIPLRVRQAPSNFALTHLPCRFCAFCVNAAGCRHHPHQCAPLQRHQFCGCLLLSHTDPAARRLCAHGYDCENSPARWHCAI